jgi:hypothetical protein
MLKRKLELVTESSDKNFHDFEPLAIPLGTSTQIISERGTGTPYVLQWCKKDRGANVRVSLAELARSCTNFVPTRFIFDDYDTVYVGSQYADICLADIIGCNMSMNETHVSAVLKPVSKRYDLETS